MEIEVEKLEHPMYKITLKRPFEKFELHVDGVEISRMARLFERAYRQGTIGHVPDELEWEDIQKYVSCNDVVDELRYLLKEMEHILKKDVNYWKQRALKAEEVNKKVQIVEKYYDTSFEEWLHDK